MIRWCFLSFSFCCVLSLFGCADSVGPVPSTNNDPRQYTWSLDTLSTFTPNDYEEIGMFDIWGLNDTLVYAAGHDANYGSASLWKYDGKKWQRVSYNWINGGSINKTIDFYAIRGLAPDDIYAFGTNWSNWTGDFLPYTIGIHFDGIQWREISMPKGKGIHSAIVVSPSQIYCGGWYDGQLYHYDGAKWSVDTIKATRYPELYIDVNLIGITNTQEPYLQTEQFKNTLDGFYYKQIVKYSKDHSIILDSAYIEPLFVRTLGMMSIRA